MVEEKFDENWKLKNKTKLLKHFIAGMQPYENPNEEEKEIIFNSKDFDDISYEAYKLDKDLKFIED